VRMERRDVSGELLAVAVAELDVAPWSVGSVPVPAAVASAGRPSRELVVVTTGPDRATWFFAADRHIDYPTPEYDAVLEPGDVLRVRVGARNLLRDVCLFPDRLGPDAVVDAMLVTLLPGESHTFAVTGLADPVDPAALTGLPVLRTANDLVNRSSLRKPAL